MMHIKNSLLYLAISLLLFQAMSAQQTMNLFYIDASEPLVNEDFFSDDEIRKLSQLVDEHSSDAMLVYYSDGNSGRMIKGATKGSEIANTIYSSVPKIPDWRYDRVKLRDFMFNAMEGFKGDVHLRFFLSDRQVKDIASGANYFVKLFPRELFAINRTGLKNVVVHLYYSNDQGKIEKERLLDVLNFYNTEFPPAITFELSEI